jgi:formate hydrogenlyase subunit 6/NADH:ubiquinone oxidoreductase subunit I
MRLGTMFGDVWNSFLHRPVTQKYPFEKREAPVRLRGKLHWDPEKCTGCQLCVKDCPSQALELITLDKKAKLFVMKYHVDRCTFCAQCVESCRPACIEMSGTDWELAATAKEPFAIYYGDEVNIDKVLENCLNSGDSNGSK